MTTTNAPLIVVSVKYSANISICLPLAAFHLDRSIRFGSCGRSEKPLASVSSPKYIDRESLGESQIGTKQAKRYVLLPTGLKETGEDRTRIWCWELVNGN